MSWGSDDEIVEIAGLEIVNGEFTGLMYQSYISSTHPMHEKARAVNHISDESVSSLRTL